MVIDSSDRERIGIAKSELHKSLALDSLSKACVLIFANKQDVANSMSPAEISANLDLVSIKNQSW
jgi:signal recognition particle receptor subunit beta